MNPTFPTPLHHYPTGCAALRILHPSSAREIAHEGRRGLHFTSIRGRAGLPRHTMYAACGTVTLWVLPLQDFSPALQLPAHARSNPFFDRFVFLSDREALQDIDAANFTFHYRSHWHPVLAARFCHMRAQRSTFGPERPAMAAGGYFGMRALRWYHLAVSWDREAGDYAIYANGIKVGSHDTSPWPSKAVSEPPAPWLYFGNPAYAMGDIAFYGAALSGTDLSRLFEAEATSRDGEVQNELENMYEGRRLADFTGRPEPSAGWRRGLGLNLREDGDYGHFFQQGCGPCLRFTPEGLRITTPGFEEYYRRGEIDLSRMYLWTRRVWEGDLWVTFEFKLHAHGGLALLMAQAAGMQGEDFLGDYPLRSDGAMGTVHREDVRNYHWEFYREMADTRNDLVSHALLKNPWLRPLGFQIENRVWELERWYRLTFLQEGARLRGVVDRVTVLDALDGGFDNNGPVFRHGRVALRAMMRTDLSVRDLEIWTRPGFTAVAAAPAAGLSGDS